MYPLLFIILTLFNLTYSPFFHSFSLAVFFETSFLALIASVSCTSLFFRNLSCLDAIFFLKPICLIQITIFVKWVAWAVSQSLQEPQRMHESSNSQPELLTLIWMHNSLLDRQLWTVRTNMMTYSRCNMSESEYNGGSVNIYQIWMLCWKLTCTVSLEVNRKSRRRHDNISKHGLSFPTIPSSETWAILK